MPKTKVKAKAKKQVNVRWDSPMIEALDIIAKEENFDRSEVVRCLVRWALPLRNIFGSFSVMTSIQRESYECFFQSVEVTHKQKLAHASQVRK